MAIARFPNVVIDCPDPGVLATFYGAMLDWKVEVSSGRAEIPRGVRRLHLLRAGGGIHTA